MLQHTRTGIWGRGFAEEQLWEGGTWGWGCETAGHSRGCREAQEGEEGSTACKEGVGRLRAMGRLGEQLGGTAGCVPEALDGKDFSSLPDGMENIRP